MRKIKHKIIPYFKCVKCTNETKNPTKVCNACQIIMDDYRYEGEFPVELATFKRWFSHHQGIVNKRVKGDAIERFKTRRIK